MMEKIMLYIILALLIIMGVGTFIGTNPNKKSSWLYALNGIGGLLIGLLLGFSRNNLDLGLQVGIIIALVSMFGAAMSRWQRQKSTELEHWHKKRSKK